MTYAIDKVLFFSDCKDCQLEFFNKFLLVNNLNFNQFERCPWKIEDKDTLKKMKLADIKTKRIYNIKKFFPKGRT